MNHVPLHHISRINRIVCAMHLDSESDGIITITISRRSAWRECWLGVTGWFCAPLVADNVVQA